jgi:hypothetical protein
MRLCDGSAQANGQCFEPHMWILQGGAMCGAGRSSTLPNLRSHHSF